MATRRSRRAASRSTSGSITSTNAAGLRQSTIPGAANLARVGQMYRPGGSRRSLQLTVSGGRATRISGS